MKNAVKASSQHSIVLKNIFKESNQNDDNLNPNKFEADGPIPKLLTKSNLMESMSSSNDKEDILDLGTWIVEMKLFEEGQKDPLYPNDEDYFVSMFTRQPSWFSCTITRDTNKITGMKSVSLKGMFRFNETVGNIESGSISNVTPKGTFSLDFQFGASTKRNGVLNGNGHIEFVDRKMLLTMNFEIADQIVKYGYILKPQL